MLIGAGMCAGLFVLREIFPPQPPAKSACESDWAKCSDNNELMNAVPIEADIEGRCKEAANGQAKYGSPVWPWIAFGNFHDGRHYIDTGIAVAVENNAQFQNQFGAMVNSRVVCTYDLRRKSVISVEVFDR